MSKIIAKSQFYIDKVSGHRYTGCTIKTPFINFSFAPTTIPFLMKGRFAGCHLHDDIPLLLIFTFFRSFLAGLSTLRIPAALLRSRRKL